MNDFLERIRSGHRHFFENKFKPNIEHYRALQKAQHPKAFVVTCCDSRFDPISLMQMDPGDLFVTRNIANLIAPYDPHLQQKEHLSTMAALEYAVNVLEVEHIIVLGHWGCGGIEGAIRNDPAVLSQIPHVRQWLTAALESCTRTHEALPDATTEEKCRHCELENVRQSLKNLRTYRFVLERLERRILALHGWYFDLPNGSIKVLNSQTDQFDPLID
jgi:carbonic anhydrase